MKLIFGMDANTLVARCLTDIHQRTIDYPDQRAFLIVPERAKVQMERQYMETTGTDGLMMAEVLSFRRLAHRLLDEAGQLPASPLDAFGRRMLIYRVLKENSDRFRSFGHLADRSGFIDQTESVIGDLKRHGIRATQLMAVAQAMDTAKPLRDKCHDLAILLDGFDKALTDRSLADGDDDLNRLAELLERMANPPLGSDALTMDTRLLSRPLGKIHVTVTGFGFTRDFTPQEHRILAQLDERCASLTVAIQADALPDSDVAAEHGPEAFLIARRTLFRLKSRFAKAETHRIPPMQTSIQSRIAGALNGSWPSGPQPEEHTDSWDGQVTRIELPSPADEVDWLAGEIRRLTQEGGYRYKDIAIAMCEPSSSLPLLRTAGRRYRLPLFLDEARSLEGTALFRFVLGLFDLSLRNWSRDAVMTVLRSGLTSLTADQSDWLENEFLARGLFRKDRLFAVGTPEGGDNDGRMTDDERRISDVVRQIFLPMRQLTDQLRQAPTTAHSCQLIRQYFIDHQMVDRIRDLVSLLQDKGEMDAALLLASAHKTLGRLLNQLESIAGPIPMTLAQLRDTIRSGLAGASVTLIPSSLDQVMVGDWRHVSRQPCRVLFVVGARSDVLPPRPAPEGLLKDLDRQQLSDLLQVRLPSNARDQVFADAGTTFQLLTRASERLYLGVSGNEPADVVRPIMDAFPGHRVRSSDDLTDLYSPRMNAPSAAWHRCSLLSGSSITLPPPLAAAWRMLAHELRGKADSMPFLAQGACPDRLEDRFSGDHPDVGCLPSGHVSTDVVARWYAPMPSLSVSQLEKYAACPYSHLATYILGLQERADDSPQSADIGTILHRTVETAVRELADAVELGGADPDLRAVLIEDFINRVLPERHAHWLSKAIKDLGPLLVRTPGFQSRISRKLSLVAVTSIEAVMRQLSADGYAPKYLEWRFGPGYPADCAIRVPNGPLLDLRGIVDRIDIRDDDGQTCFRIIDYKSGNTVVDPDRLYHGLDLQLPVYVAAFSRNNPDYVADEAAYFRFDWPVHRLERAGKAPVDIGTLQRKHFQLRKTEMSREALALVSRHAVSQSESLAESLFDGRFEVAPRRVRGKEAACRYCPYAAVCGFNRKSYHYLDPVTRLAAVNEERLNRRQALIRLLERQDPCRTGGESHETARGEET